MSADPKLTIKTLLETEWGESMTELNAGTQPVFHTGAYDRDEQMPSFAIHQREEGPIRSGETGATALDGATGLGMQRVGGTVLVDCVAGTVSDLETAASDGGRLSPKDVRWQMYDSASQIVLDAQSVADLRTVMPIGGIDREDTDEGPAVYRVQFRVRYIRDRKPSPSA